MITILNNNKFPLISCLCVTRNRSELLSESIKLFQNQSYSNKEMIIIYYSNDKKTKEIYRRNVDKRIIFFEYNIGDNKTLGDLRNMSIDVANGEYVCIWDDDDWYSNKRLLTQFAFIQQSKKDACTIGSLTIFSCKNKEMKNGINRLDGWEPSLMCKKETIQKIGYDSLNVGEDVVVIKELYKEDLIHCITDEMLYVYFIHNENTSENNRLKDLWRISKKPTNHNFKELMHLAKTHIELHIKIYNKKTITKLFKLFSL